MSRQSGVSASDKCDNEVNPEAVDRSPGIYLTAVKSHGKPQIRDHVTKAVGPVIALE